MRAHAHVLIKMLSIVNTRWNLRPLLRESKQNWTNTSVSTCLFKIFVFAVTRRVFTFKKYLLYASNIFSNCHYILAGSSIIIITLCRLDGKSWLKWISNLLVGALCFHSALGAHLLALSFFFLGFHFFLWNSQVLSVRQHFMGFNVHVHASRKQWSVDHTQHLTVHIFGRPNSLTTRVVMCIMIFFMLYLWMYLIWIWDISVSSAMTSDETITNSRYIRKHRNKKKKAWYHT